MAAATAIAGPVLIGEGAVFVVEDEFDGVIAIGDVEGDGEVLAGFEAIYLSRGRRWWVRRWPGEGWLGGQRRLRWDGDIGVAIVRFRRTWRVEGWR